MTAPPQTEHAPYLSHEPHAHHETPAPIQRLGRAALYLAAGYAMHRGLSADIVPGPETFDALGSPFAGIAETAAIGTTLGLVAVRHNVGFGLKTNVVDRFGSAEKRSAKLERKEQQANREARHTQDAYEKTIEGKPAATDPKTKQVIPHVRDPEEYTPTESRLGNINRRLRNTGRAFTSKLTGRHLRPLEIEDMPASGATSRKLGRAEDIMIYHRNKRTTASYHARHQSAWWFKSRSLFPEPKGDRKGYRKAVNLYSKAKHHMEHANHKAHKPVNEALKQAEEFRKRRENIRAREARKAARRRVGP